VLGEKKVQTKRKSKARSLQHLM